MKEPEEDLDRFNRGRRVDYVLPLVKAGLDVREVQCEPITKELLAEIEANLLRHHQEKAAEAAARSANGGNGQPTPEELADRPSANGPDGEQAAKQEEPHPSVNGPDGGPRPAETGAPSSPPSPNAVQINAGKSTPHGSARPSPYGSDGFLEAEVPPGWSDEAYWAEIESILNDDDDEDDL